MSPVPGFKWKTPLKPKTVIHPLRKLWFAGSQRTLRRRGVDSNFSSAILIVLRRPAFVRRISARLSKELNGLRRSPHFRQGHR